jgi:hypothetical protein
MPSLDTPNLKYSTWEEKTHTYSILHITYFLLIFVTHVKDVLHVLLLTLNVLICHP